MPERRAVECVRILRVNGPVLVLASNSPRRRELLRLGLWEFITRPAEVDESPHPGEEPGSYVLRLAGSKALACLQNQSRTAGSILEGEIILAADTAVVHSQAIL